MKLFASRKKNFKLTGNGIKEKLEIIFYKEKLEYFIDNS
jgi:hypothetical protein